VSRVFQVIPAVDVLDGRAVRLERGDFDAVTAEAGDPVELARRFVATGPPLLHVVVLDAARDGGAPIELARRLATAIAPVPLQLGGGVRTPADAFALFGAGAARVIVGTAAFEQGPEAYVEALGDRLVVAVDVRDGEVRVRGWEHGSGLSVEEAVDRCRAAGVARLLCTAVERDGTMSGPNLELMELVVRRFEGPVLAAGGVRGRDDLDALAAVRCEGAVVGRALLEQAQL
jgi:phosphoribosylformimino-5-aminoimidazole carboxamide ribotide isomerase